MDLTNPALKGKVSMQSTQDWSDGMYSFFYFAALLGLIGEKKWDEFVKAFLRTRSPQCSRAITTCKSTSQGETTRSVASAADQGGLEVETLALSDVPKTASMRSIGIVAEASTRETQNCSSTIFCLRRGRTRWARTTRA